MQFFNFNTTESFHFFVWLTESGQVDVDDLIAKAFKAAESDEFLGWGCISDAIRNALANCLSTLLEELLPEACEESLIGVGVGQVRNSLHALTEPLLSLAISRIDTQAVAVALLIRAGKFHPEHHSKIWYTRPSVPPREREEA